MEQIKDIISKSKKDFYNQLNIIIKDMIENESDWLAILSNSAAFLGLKLEDINWAGYYLYKNSELILGPFYGKPACTHIEIGEGVCGTAAKKLETVVVKNVLEFPGHIACDCASRSEIVVPIVSDGKLVGVLDIDSPIFDRFNEEDKAGLEQFVEILNKYVNWSDVN